MLPDQRDIYYQIMCRRQKLIQEREQDRLRRTALEGRRQNRPRQAFNLTRWFRRLLPKSAMRPDGVTVRQRPAEEGGLPYG